MEGHGDGIRKGMGSRRMQRRRRGKMTIRGRRREEKGERRRGIESGDRRGRIRMEERERVRARGEYKDGNGGWG